MCLDSTRLNIKSAIKVKSYDSIHVALNVGRSRVLIIIIYRIDQTKKNNLRSEDFIAEFASLIDDLSSIADAVIIAGSYDIDWDKPGETEIEH